MDYCDRKIIMKNTTRFNCHWDTGFKYLFLAFSSVIRQMPGYNSPRRGTARTVPIIFLCFSMYCFFLSFCGVVCV
jgi:hypothetical protein